MKFLGVGLSKTGTSSLHRALTMVGLKCIHYDRIRLNDILDGTTTNPNFRRYDDVDAVTDLPSAFFYRELLAAYPNCRAILTTRDVDAWWRSVEVHMNIGVSSENLEEYLVRAELNVEVGGPRASVDVCCGTVEDLRSIAP